MVPAPTSLGIEEGVVHLVLWLKLAIEVTGALIIGIGVIIAIKRFIQTFFVQSQHDFTEIRLTLARFLALALEFQLGADILSTAVAPTWEQIGKLGAIAVIRTALNYFLTREMHDEHGATRSADRQG